MSPEKSIIVSQSDSELADLIASQPKDFADVKIKEGPQNIWELPPECNKMAAKYRYRWVSKDKRMVMRARTKGWLICNRINSPYLPDHLFAMHGGVERLGHILAFMPNELAEAIMAKNIKKSQDAVKAMEELHKSDPRFYKAKISPEEDGSDDNPKGFIQGRDF